MARRVHAQLSPLRRRRDRAGGIRRDDAGELRERRGASRDARHRGWVEANPEDLRGAHRRQWRVDCESGRFQSDGEQSEFLEQRVDGGGVCVLAAFARSYLARVDGDGHQRFVADGHRSGVSEELVVRSARFARGWVGAVLCDEALVIAHA